MGAWSIKPFGNDAALDWFNELKESKSPFEYIHDTLRNAGDEEIVAAAAIVSAGSLEKVRGISKEQKQWIETSGYVPGYSTIEDAIIRLHELLNGSELKELWDESGSGKVWVKDITRILNQLEVSLEQELPKRIPKKKGIPRAFYKLVELYSKSPEELIRKRIHKKIESLVNLNEGISDTGHVPALCLLSKHGLLDEIALLLERGADPNPSTRGFCPSPLTLACLRGDIDVADKLLEYGADLFKEFVIDELTGMMVSDLPEKADCKPVHVTLALGLFAAARKGTPEIIDFLIHKGCDINQCDLNGETLLHKAVESGNLSTTRYLIELGLNVNKGKHGNEEPALHYSIQSEKLEAAKVLLEAGACVNAVESYYCDGRQHYIAPLDMAMQSKNENMIELLQSYGALSAKDILNKQE